MTVLIIVTVIIVVILLSYFIAWLKSCHHDWNLIKEEESISTDYDLKLNGGSSTYKRIMRTMRCNKCGTIKKDGERIRL